MLWSIIVLWRLFEIANSTQFSKDYGYFFDNDHQMNKYSDINYFFIFCLKTFLIFRLLCRWKMRIFGCDGFLIYPTLRGYILFPMTISFLTLKKFTKNS